MPITAWNKRAEPLGIFVTREMPKIHHSSLGDQWHRIAVRDQETPLIVVIGVYTPLRSVISKLACGSRVGCYAHDSDDIPPFFKRLTLLAPGYFDKMYAAIFYENKWSTRPIAL